MERVYHFVTGCLRSYIKKQPIDIHAHFISLVQQDRLLSSRLRDPAQRGLMHTTDPVEDYEYVFLTSKRYLVNHIYEAAPKAYGYPVYGFVFNAERFRNAPGVLFRCEDIMSGDRREDVTEPFRQQALTYKCELMIPSSLHISKYLINYIVQNEEVSCAQLNATSLIQSSSQQLKLSASHPME